MSFAVNRGVRLSYGERGKGDPVLLIMGYAARAAHWGEEFRDLLASNHRVVSFDNRGTGDSDKPANPWTMADMARDAAAVMEAVGLACAHVVGLSMGGMVAQELALSDPARVRTLSLVATHSGGPGVVPPAPEVTAAMFNPDRSISAVRRIENIWRAICAPGFLDDPRRREACLRLDLEKPIPLAMLANQAQAVMASDRSGRLSQIRVPTLAVTGTEDHLVPPANSDRLAALIPGARLVRIPGCGHMVPLEKPRELARILLAFFAEHREG